MTLRDVTFDGGSAAKHGLNIYHAGMVTLENVEISNCRWYALVVNGTELSVDGLTTSRKPVGRQHRPGQPRHLCERCYCRGGFHCL